MSLLIGAVSAILQRSQSALGTLSLIDWSHSKGRLRCQFRSLPYVARRAKAPVKSPPAHLFMAKGPVENGNNIVCFVIVFLAVRGR